MIFSTDIDIRAIAQADLADWDRALKTGSPRGPFSLRGEQDLRYRTCLPGRSLGAFDHGRCVATLRSFTQELTAVGGAAVPANAITDVTVAATHRRRGLLDFMMTKDLTAAKGRGDVVATTFSAEHPVFRRHGFGHAASATEWTIDVARTGLDPLWASPEDGGRIDLMEGNDIRALGLGPTLHERWCRFQPGAVNRDDHWWGVSTAADNRRSTWYGPRFAVYRSADGEAEGIVSYSLDDNLGSARLPSNTVSVDWLIAVSPHAQSALWRHLCSIDGAVKVRSGWRAPDDHLPLLLPDLRAATVTGHRDWLWVRILDIVQALEARTYDAAGTLNLEVVDTSGPTSGRYRLEVAHDGSALCAPTDERPDLTMAVADLATLWLGEETATRLVGVSRIQENRAGAARRADVLLHTAGRPWCPDAF
ncbi:GNAT family N-acetyltransferase [Streptomyces sp. WAC 01325]|uniref:GNAT family N-acetyltransferase n=1 Tax=Streptomyces sp. WAC 01325 TaxID=2203202 RepID=UPI000F87A45E|nr:GNAT family N-acetyltransferase [Streptomyces sp. WAC 01325]RSM80861.1 GNAT family N-acetyltransferase [Streptomyces sp. WAC 01325]